ncbi:MAG: putative nitrogen fixation protein NifT [Thioploca sp.]|jgi:nitrogen fixation protein NifT|nr:putative nitrogen fixation protein NifT [Thioploca sp.]
MANIMIRQDTSGDLIFYLAKKDLEEKIIAIEFNSPDKWGGELKLADGQAYYVTPFTERPKLPITVRARRL